MSGMSLRTAVSAGASFSPGMPVAASTPSAGGMSKKTIGQQAYGVSSGANVGPARVAIGSVTVGMLSFAALVFIWWSLPR